MGRYLCNLVFAGVAGKESSPKGEISLEGDIHVGEVMNLKNEFKDGLKAHDIINNKGTNILNAIIDY